MESMRHVSVTLFFVTLAGCACAQGGGYGFQTISNPATSNVDFGSSIALVGDVDGDSKDDFVVTDPFLTVQSVPGLTVGEVRLVSGGTGATIRSHYGSSGASSGSIAAAAGDFDFDGVPDYAFGDFAAYGPTVPGVPAGKIEVWSGATGALLFTMTGGVYLPGIQNLGDQLGSSVCAPGDVTGDGVPDLVIGAQGGSSPSGQAHGKVLIRSGLTGAVSTANGTIAGSFFGAAVCGPGDLNGDGVADLVVGAPGGPGYVQAYAGGTGAILWTANAPTPNVGFGSVLDSAGDFDGDGVKDVVVGAPLSVSVGGGPLSSGQAFVLSGVTGLQLWTISGTMPNERLGSRVSRAGDVNGDGFGDVLVSSPNAFGAGQGKVQLVFGPTGVPTQVIATGAVPFEHLGTGLAGGGFLNPDAVPDVLIGAPDSTSSGRVIALSGATMTNLYQVSGSTAPFLTGHFASAVDAGDQDGDGNADLALGLVSANGPLVLVSGTTSQIIRFLPGPLPGTSAADPNIPVARLGDIDNDGVQDLAVAAAIGVNPAGVDSVQMDVVSGLTGQVFHSTTWSRCGLGWVDLVAPADFDADGIRDLVVGLSIGPSSCPGPLVGGRIEIRSGATGALLAQALGANPLDGFARSIDSAGDLDGDGIVDVLVGAPFDRVGIGSGRVSAYSGAGLVPLFSVTGTAPNQGLGASVAGIGDVSGDGIPDFAAADAQPSLTSSVPVRLFSGAGGAPLGVLPVPAGFGFGKTIAGVGDVDGDGVPDVAVGAPAANAPFGAVGAGEVFVFSGAGGPALFSTRGQFANEGLGNAIAGIGDWNKDGLADVFAAAGGVTVQAEILSFAGVPTGSQVIGSPCTLASGRKPSLAAFGGDPTSATGNPFFGLIVSNGGAGALGALAVGSSTTSWGGTPLPLALAPALPGCSLYVSVDNLVPFVLGTGLGGLGAVKFPIAVPVAPGLAGITAHLQAYVADSGTGALPGAVTRGLTVVVQ
jgi:FG-GAP repeat